MRHAKKKTQAEADAYICTDACVCADCGGPTWYYLGKHVCIRVACGASR